RDVRNPDKVPGASDSQQACLSYYPVFLDLRGRRCVVIGGGPVATEKARALVDADAHVDIIASRPIPKLETLPVRLFYRGYQHGDLVGALLAIDTTGDARVREEAEAQHVLLNVVDTPAECDFIAPAVVRRGPLQVAVSTSGESPYLAGHIRNRLEAAYGAEWADFVRLTGSIRRGLRRRGVSVGRQKVVYEMLLRSEVRDLLREGAVEAAQRQANTIVDWVLNEVAV
ncbi:MAG: bifunctional precorrin-2 dehydrogenase/sirohydrochlorin ferrochelatase, partial [Chloroflexota bacterium]|nr:bifunctional precorrin-2 dehydrogenase/sirohydrochlorin ferrochelatase [Chloroflexota bacterium]